jgi:hypothetical protein
MLTVATSTAMPANSATTVDGLPICSSAPITMMPEIALVTLINGVCSDGATFQTTWKPTKMASTKTVKCCMNLNSAAGCCHWHK